MNGPVYVTVDQGPTTKEIIESIGKESSFIQGVNRESGTNGKKYGSRNPLKRSPFSYIQTKRQTERYRITSQQDIPCYKVPGIVWRKNASPTLLKYFVIIPI